MMSLLEEEEEDFLFLQPYFIYKKHGNYAAIFYTDTIMKMINEYQNK